MGAHQAALFMEEQRVVKSVRNDVNRLINAEMANQQKTSRAAGEQIGVIREVLSAYGFEKLPPALQEFIRLRVQHPGGLPQRAGGDVRPAPFQVRYEPPRAPPPANGRGIAVVGDGR